MQERGGAALEKDRSDFDERKKIGILTFHKSYNYGAFMQCYSLTQRLKADFQDCLIEVIDYTAKSITRQYDTTFFGYVFKGFRTPAPIKIKVASFIKNAVTYIFRHQTIKDLKKRNERFRDAWETLPLSKPCIISDDYHLLFSELKKREYDAVIVGSDAVWNWNIRGFPNAYFLRGDFGAEKLSYAASSYGQEFADLSEKMKDYLAEAFGDFTYIGVRDKATEQLVRFARKDLTPVHNCDPTVLLDLTCFDELTEKNSRYLTDMGIDLNKPIIGLMGDNWLGRLLRDIVGDRYQIVAVYIKNDFADVFLSELNPFEWAMVFSLFSVTFTHFFHGTVFSLKNLTPVFAVETGETPYSLKYDTKIKDLLKRLDLTDFYYTKANIDKEKAVLISGKIDEYVQNPPKKRIKTALEKEAESYTGFKNTVEEILNKEPNNDTN